MRISFDSNAWERLFDSANTKYKPVHTALKLKRISGLISEVAFRIEAVQKRQRSRYFAQPHFDMQFNGIEQRNGVDNFKMSIGPVNSNHPGLDPRQKEKLNLALAEGVLVMRGMAWMGLPVPIHLQTAEIFVPEAPAEFRDREQLQMIVFDAISKRGAGKAAFDAAGGWNNLRPENSEKQFWRACSEWADGELVASHVGYRNDVLCTDDFGGRSSNSVFSSINRSWLTAKYGVAFCTLEELLLKFQCVKGRRAS